MKVFFLGLDGLTLKSIEPYIKAGLLSNFSKIMTAGSYGVLKSTIPPLTGPGWTSLMTGKNPGKHGVYEFREQKGYELSFITKPVSSALPVWQVLNNNNKKTVALNIPFSYPPDTVDSVLVSGFMTPDKNAEFTYPPELKKEILELIPDYKLDVNSDMHMLTGNRAALLDDIFKITNDRHRLMNHFLDSHEWDFFQVIFIGTDRIQHVYWDEVISMEPRCVEYYRLIDKILGDILKWIEEKEATLFVASDHGFMGVNKGFHINNYLEQLGYLKIKGSLRVKKKLARANVTSNNIKLILRKIGITEPARYIPGWLKSMLRGIISHKSVQSTEIDWSQTKAFSLLGYGIVSLNLKGREPEGIVESDQYSGILDELCKSFLELKDPSTGKNVVKEVYLGDHIYSDDCPKQSPDLVVIMNDGYLVKEEIGVDIFGDNKMGNLTITGDHDRDGMFIAYGKVIKAAKRDTDIYDILPTILYLMDAAVPRDIDGKVFKEIINDEFLCSHQIKTEKIVNTKNREGRDLTESERDAIEKRLRELGYLS